MSERSDKVLMEYMLEAVNRVLEYTAGYSSEAFGKDKKTVDAVLRNLQVLGKPPNKSQMPLKKPILKSNGQKLFAPDTLLYMNNLALIWKLLGGSLKHI